MQHLFYRIPTVAASKWLLQNLTNSIIHDNILLNELNDCKNWLYHIQFRCMIGSGTTDAIFIVRRFKKHTLKRNKIYSCFYWPREAFDRVPRKGLWWGLRKVDIPEWIIYVIQIMYKNARSKIRINNLLSDDFNVEVVIFQGTEIFVAYLCSSSSFILHDLISKV